MLGKSNSCRFSGRFININCESVRLREDEYRAILSWLSTVFRFDKLEASI